MTGVPETRYAKAAEGGYIAYQVVGDGPIDPIFVPDWWNHIEVQWGGARVRTLLAPTRHRSVG